MNPFQFSRTRAWQRSEYGRPARTRSVGSGEMLVLETRAESASSGRGWTVVWELLLRAQRLGCRMTGCAITLRPRSHGVSKVNNLRNVAANLRQLFALNRLLDD